MSKRNNNEILADLFYYALHEIKSSKKKHLIDGLEKCFPELHNDIEEAESTVITLEPTIHICEEGKFHLEELVDNGIIPDTFTVLEACTKEKNTSPTFSELQKIILSVLETSEHYVRYVNWLSQDDTFSDLISIN